MPSMTDFRRYWQTLRPNWRIETLALAGSLFFTLACNSLFWQSVLDGRSWSAPAT